MRRGLWYFLSAQKVDKTISFRWSGSEEKSQKKAVFLSFNSSVLLTGYSHYKAKFYMFFVAQRTKRPAHEKNSKEGRHM